MKIQNIKENNKTLIGQKNQSKEKEIGGTVGVMQISSFRGSEEPNGITSNSDERVAKVTCWTFFAKDCKFSLQFWDLANIS